MHLCECERVRTDVDSHCASCMQKMWKFPANETAAINSFLFKWVSSYISTPVNISPQTSCRYHPTDYAINSWTSPCFWCSPLNNHTAGCRGYRRQRNITHTLWQTRFLHDASKLSHSTYKTVFHMHTVYKNKHVIMIIIWKPKQ